MGQSKLYGAVSFCVHGGGKFVKLGKSISVNFGTTCH